jgi:hypothetical protein
MQTIDTLTPQELDAIIRNLPSEALLGPIPRPKKWKRVDVGQIEVYVGDRLYVVALCEKLPQSIDEMASNQVNTEDTVIKYLRSEGWIDEEYAYVGMQRFSLKQPPKGFTNEKDSEGLPPDM